MFGQRLKAARQQAGVSQRALAFAGCSPATISQLEAGARTTPSLRVVRELARRLDVSAEYLLGSDQSAPPTASRLVDADIALRLDDVAQARRLYEEALGGLGDVQEEIDARTGLGKIALRDGHTEEAIELLERALELAGGDPTSRPGLTETLGRAYAQAGRFAAAAALFKRCVDGYESDADPTQHIRFLCLLGYALTDHGDLGEAERVIAKALQRGWDAADPYTRARLYWSQSRLLGEQNKSDASARYAAMALDALRSTEDTYSLALAHQLLAHAYLDAGRADEALEVIREARPLVEATATPTDRAHFEVEEARALAALGYEQEAASIASAAAGRLNTARPIDAGRAYLLLAEVYERLGDRERQCELLELAIELIEVQSHNRYLIDAYRKLALILEEDGRPAEALEALKRAAALQEHVSRAIR